MTMIHLGTIEVLPLLLLSLFVNGGLGTPCASRDYGHGSVVCVCNSSYCDTLEPVSVPPKGNAASYVSSKSGKRFFKSVLKFSSSYISGPVIVSVNKSQRHQFILGFGGAFTDAAGINIASLPVSMQSDIINSYYSSKGAEYSMGRVPMASCDFSTHVYSYDDVDGDFNLTNFKLAEEDYKYKIPFIKMAQKVSKNLYLFGSPWSAPAWMKTNGKMYGAGSLKGQPGGQYYQTWADYFVKFLQLYQKENITFWGLTAQNEPSDGFIPKFSFQAMAFTVEMQRDFIKFNLGLTLKKAGFGVDNIQLMILDDLRFFLPRWADVVLSDPEAAQYVGGIAYHWYFNAIAPARLLDIVHEKHPGTFLLSTEACTGSFPWDLQKVILGSWQRAEYYAHDIIQDLLHWTVGWIDWNLALDTEGGPNWVKNFVDAPIIVNASSREFYKQPMYYVLAHFSKLLPPGSIRIGLTIKSNFQCSECFDVGAFITPKNNLVLIVVNRHDSDVSLILQDEAIGHLNVTVEAHSIQSFIWATS